MVEYDYILNSEERFKMEPIVSLVALVPVGIFIVVKTGLIKSWFILETLPGLLSGRMVYAMLPFGISFVLVDIVIRLPNYDPRNSNALTIALLMGPIFGFWFMARPPKWLDPKWLQWLKQEYGYCIDILIEDAQMMNRWDWERQVRTHEGMQRWIDDVFDLRREEIDFAWQTEKLYRVDQQNLKQEIYILSPGMKVEGEVPLHRQDDIALVREEIDAVIAIRNARYRPEKPIE